MRLESPLKNIPFFYLFFGSISWQKCARTHKTHLCKNATQISRYCCMFFAASKLGSVLHLFLVAVFTGRSRLVQVSVRLQRLMSLCDQDSSEITVSGSGGICRHGDKPVSLTGERLFSPGVSRWCLPACSCWRWKRANTTSSDSCFCIRRHTNPSVTQSSQSEFSGMASFPLPTYACL